jgi:hypothetical protein
MGLHMSIRSITSTSTLISASRYIDYALKAQLRLWRNPQRLQDPFSQLPHPELFQASFRATLTTESTKYKTAAKPPKYTTCTALRISGVRSLAGSLFMAGPLGYGHVQFVAELMGMGRGHDIQWTLTDLQRPHNYR